MATSSIFTNVRIKNKAECQKLIAALECAEKEKSTPSDLSHPVDIVVGEAIKELFRQS